MGKAKKIGLGIGISVLIFFALVIIVSLPNIDDSKKRYIQSVESEIVKFENMSFESLEKISQDWTFKDILRNIDNYKGKIIFVEGTVTNVQRDVNSLNLCTYGTTSYSVFSCEEFMFVRVNGIDTWLEDDKLSGFVEVRKLTERGTVSVLTGGEWVGSGDYVPSSKEIKLTCSNC